METKTTEVGKEILGTTVITLNWVMGMTFSIEADGKGKKTFCLTELKGES